MEFFRPMHVIQGVHGCTQSCTVHAPLILTTLPIDIYIFGISPTFLIIWDHFGQNWRHFLKKYFFSPKGPPFGFWALKNQKNPNCEKFWPDWAKPLFIWLYGTHKLLDSVEKSQTPENFFYYVPQCYLCLFYFTPPKNAMVKEIHYLCIFLQNMPW